MEKPRIGISACLLGHNVRYNKGHTRDKWIINKLSEHVDFFPMCPEIEMGLGVPREEISLYHKENGEQGLIGKFSKQDLTDQAHKAYQRLYQEISRLNLNGFIMMKKSPSCGLSDAKNHIYQKIINDQRQGQKNPLVFLLQKFCMTFLMYQ